MSLCNNKQYFINLFKSLHKSANRKISIKVRRETPLCTCKEVRKASFTVEASIVIPLVTGFLVYLLFFFRVMQIETEVYAALSYASRKTAAIESMAEAPVAEFAIAEGYFMKALAESNVTSQYVGGAVKLAALKQSDFSGEYVDLIADYKIPLPVRFFSVKSIHIRQESKSRKWTGAAVAADEAQDMYVYITEYGTVYHLSKDCNYLDLSIQATKMACIEGLRNKSEHKYYPCERCVVKNIDSDIVYITDYGTAYHSSLQCSGLKRTVSVVPQSTVKDRRGCSKCVKQMK